MSSKSLNRIHPNELIGGVVAFFSGYETTKVLRGDSGVMFLTSDQKVGEFIFNSDFWEMWIEGEMIYSFEDSVYRLITDDVIDLDAYSFLEKTKELIVDTSLKYKSKIFLIAVYQNVLKMIIYSDPSKHYQLKTIPFSVIKTRLGVHISGLN
jgi:hypothetical protein